MGRGLQDQKAKQTIYFGRDSDRVLFMIEILRDVIYRYL